MSEGFQNEEEYRRFRIPEGSPEQKQALPELIAGHFLVGNVSKVSLFRSRPEHSQQGIIMSVFCGDDEEPDSVYFFDIELTRFLHSGLGEQLEALEGSDS